MNVEPRADAHDPVYARPAETPLGGGEIRLQSELHIGRLALEHRDPQTSPFGERAIVGKPDMTFLGRPTMRLEERSEPERLRGLDRAKPGAIRRVDDLFAIVHHLDRVRGSDAWDRRTVGATRGDRPLDERRARKR